MGKPIHGIKADLFIGDTDDPLNFCLQAPEMTECEFSPTAANPAYSSNRTKGYKRRVAGIQDGTLTISGMHDPGDPITNYLVPTTEFVAHIITDKTQRPGDPQRFIVNAIVKDVKFSLKLNSDEIESWTVTAEGDGEWKNIKATPA